MGIVIRNVRKGDRSEMEAAYKVYLAAFQTLRGIYSPNKDALSRQRERFADDIRFVAMEDGEVLGTVQLTLQGSHAMLIGLAVHPDHWRRGICKKLMDACGSLASANGCRQLSLNTIAETGNVEIFEAMGFVNLRQEIPVWCNSETGEKLTEVHMRKELLGSARVQWC